MTGTAQGDPTTPRVLSVQVGAPQVLRWHDRDVLTGIVKVPVDGPVAVGPVGLAGDGQADLVDHGGPDKAVYAYAEADYAWWREAEGRDWRPGDFGENVTTDGVDLSSAVVGTRVRVGTCLLQVSQPRSPCFKLGLRVGDDGFTRRFRTAARWGAYLRVLEPGHLAAGDRVDVLDAPIGPTVCAAGQAKHARRPDEDVVRAMAACEALAGEWRAWAVDVLVGP